MDGWVGWLVEYKLYIVSRTAKNGGFTKHLCISMNISGIIYTINEHFHLHIYAFT